MENTAQELQDLAKSTIDSEASGKNPKSDAANNSESAKPESDKKSMKDTVYNYSQSAWNFAQNAVDTVASFTGEICVATAITTSLAILGIILLEQIGLGLIGGLAVILGSGLILKYLGGIVGGRGFNPLNNFS
jgi:hypothetical protein